VARRKARRPAADKAVRGPSGFSAGELRDREANGTPARTQRPAIDFDRIKVMEQIDRHKQHRGKPTDLVAVPLDARGAPDLQLFVQACGTRYARSVGETYDPKRHGGYRHVHDIDWQAWDAAVARWQVERRIGLGARHDR
jgi:hypothetical protein